MMRWVKLARMTQALGYTRGVELGCKEGRTTEHLLTMNPALHLTVVDLWERCPDNDAQSYGHWNWSDIRKEFAARTERFADRLSIYHMSTSDAAAIFKCGREWFDFAFVDADHSERGVERDAREWWELIRTGGTMYGHDIDWPTVRAAVERVFGTFEEWQDGDNLWWKQKGAAV